MTLRQTRPRSSSSSIIVCFKASTFWQETTNQRRLRKWYVCEIENRDCLFGFALLHAWLLVPKDRLLLATFLRHVWRMNASSFERFGAPLLPIPKRFLSEETSRVVRSIGKEIQDSRWMSLAKRGNLVSPSQKTYPRKFSGDSRLRRWNIPFRSQRLASVGLHGAEERHVDLKWRKWVLCIHRKEKHWRALKPINAWN